MTHRTYDARRSWLALGAATLVMGACHERSIEDGAPANEPFFVDVDVASGPNRPTPGVELVTGGDRLATTDTTGHARLALRGAEGDNVELSVRCPARFQSPGEPLVVSLRRFSCAGCAPHFSATCSPLVRTVVVGIRADNGAHLPVVHLGKEVGRTDASGAAHVLLLAKPGEQVSLSLDTTSDPKTPRRRPENPTLTFVAKDSDDFVTLDLRFELDRAPARARPRPSPVRI